MYIDSRTYEQRKGYFAEYRRRNIERYRQYEKERYWNNKGEIIERNKHYLKKYAESVKSKVYIHYGNRCVCCGETTPEFLTIDHMNNDGGRFRRTRGGGRGSGRQLYMWIVRNGFPNDLQLLCFNCNCVKLRTGLCPHRRPLVHENLQQ